LATFRGYEIEVTKQDFYNGCSIYDPNITRSQLGSTFTYLVERGYLINPFSYSSTFIFAFHPVIAELMVNRLETTMDYWDSESNLKLLILKKYLEKKSIVEFENIKEKLGDEFNLLQFEVFETLKLLIHDESENKNGVEQKIRIYKLLKDHPKFSNLLDPLFTKDDVELIIAELNPYFSTDDYELKYKIIDHLDPELTSIDGSGFLNSLIYWIEEDGGIDVGVYEIANGYNQIRFLLEKKPDFIQSCQLHICELIKNNDTERFFNFISRIPKHYLDELNFEKIPILFGVILYLERNKRNHAYDSYDCIEYLEELLEIWNGPSYSLIRDSIFNGLIESIQTFRPTFWIAKKQESELQDTQYEINRHFIDNLRENFEIRSLLDSHEFKITPATTLGIHNYPEISLLKRILLIEKYFPDFYKILVADKTVNNIVHTKIEKLLLSNKERSFYHDEVRLVNVLQNFDLRIKIEDIRYMKLLSNFGELLLFVTDFTNLENIIEEIQFYNWGNLISKIETVREDMLHKYTNLEKEKAELIKIASVILSKVRSIYEKINSKDIQKHFEKIENIDSKDVEYILVNIIQYSDLSSFSFKFFEHLEKMLNDHLEKELKKKPELYKTYQDSYAKLIWKASLDLDLGEESKQRIYDYILQRFEKFNKSPFVKYPRTVDSFDKTMFYNSLLKFKAEPNLLIAYFLDNRALFTNIPFTDIVVPKFFEILSKFVPSSRSDNFVTLLITLTKYASDKTLLTKTEIRNYFNIEFFAKVCSNLGIDYRIEFLNYLTVNILNTRLTLKLADFIGINQLSTDFLVKCNIVRKEQQDERGTHYRIDLNEINEFYDLVFNDNFGRRLLTRTFELIDFSYYDQHDRYRLLLSLDEIVRNYEELKDLIFQLHSELITEIGDPFFIIDPTYIGHIPYGKEERLYDFLVKESQIRNKIKKEFELIVLSIYGESRWNKTNREFLLELIVQVWGSLFNFSSDLLTWEESSREVLYEFLVGKGEYFHDIKRIFGDRFVINQEQRELLRIILNEDISGFFDFLGKYTDDPKTLQLILSTTKVGDWEWDLREIDEDSYLYSDNNYRKKITYLEKIWELDELLPFDTTQFFQRIIPNLSAALSFEILKSSSDLVKLYGNELVQGIDTVPIIQLMKLLVTTNLSKIIPQITKILKHRLQENDLASSNFVIYLDFAYYCKSQMILKSTTEKLSGVIELKQILDDHFTKLTLDDIAEVLVHFESPKLVILTTFYFSEPKYLNLITFSKTTIENIVDLFEKRPRHERTSIHSLLSYLLDDEDIDFQELKYDISLAKVWEFIYPVLGIDLLKELRDDVTYSHNLIILMSQNYVTRALSEQDLMSYIEIIFSKQRLQYLRRYLSQTQHRDHVSYFTNALTTILIRIISTSQYKEVIVSLVEKIYNDYLALLAWQYLNTSSWLTIKILTILTRILNRNVQSEFILAYQDQLENTYYYKPILYLPQGRRNAQVQIRQLNFIKSHLIEIYKFILENIPYSTFTNALNNSDTPRDFKEVFWYFCNDEDWKEEAKNYAQSKLVSLS